MHRTGTVGHTSNKPAATAHLGLSVVSSILASGDAPFCSFNVAPLDCKKAGCWATCIIHPPTSTESAAGVMLILQGTPRAQLWHLLSSPGCSSLRNKTPPFKTLTSPDAVLYVAFTMGCFLQLRNSTHGTTGTQDHRHIACGAGIKIKYLG